jgi:hypothetical protein
MVTWLLVVTLAAAPGSPATGASGPRPAASSTIADRVTEARKACAAGRVDEGVEILAGIIGESGDLNALYNQARCYQLNGRTEQAITRFREYLRTAHDISGEEKARVEGFIKELDADLEAKARREALARAALARAASAAPARPAAPSPPAAVALAPRPVTRTSPALRIASLALGATGAVALVAGGYFSWKMARVSDDLESEWSLTSAQFKQRWDDGKRFELLARIGYGVGAAALVGSATCFVLSRRAAERERGRLALAPLLVAGGGGGLLRVRF